MPIVAGALRRLLARIPADNPTVYAMCKEFIDRQNGDNNSDMRTNGERWLMGQRLPASRIVFDVGANVGDWTALALEFNPQLNVHCFEPSPLTFRRLAERKFGPNVIRNNLGLGARAETRTLYSFGEASPLNSLYIRRGMEAGRGRAPQRPAETVQLESLDAYCQARAIERIDFLKLDVEGHELEVLKGAAGILARGRVGLVQLEYGGANIDARTLLIDVFDFFAPLAFAAHKLLPNGLRRVERYDQQLENFQYQNWAFISL